MLTIKCAKCKSKIFRYVKIGKGKLLHCWKDRIYDDFSIHDDKLIKCKCGNVIGVNQDKWVKLKQNSFIFSGNIAK